MKEIDGLYLDRYEAHILHPVRTMPSEIRRDVFKARNGLPVYSQKQIGLKEIEFDLEIKGSRSEIELRKSRIANDFELCRLKLRDGRFYEGTFYITDVKEVHNGFEIVAFKGECVAYKDRIRQVDLQLGESTFYIADNIETPVILYLKGCGSNLVIKGFGEDITIKNLSKDIVIDGKNKTVKYTDNTNAFNDVDLFEFPKLKEKTVLAISGTGSFNISMEYYERVI